MTRSAFLFLVATLTGCPPPSDPEPVCLPALEQQSEFLDLKRVVVGTTDAGVRVFGGPGSVAADVSVEVEGVPLLLQDDGSFLADLEGYSGEQVELSLSDGVNSEILSLRVRTLPGALDCVAHSTFATGTLPNDVEVTAACHGELSALVPLSGDGSVDVVGLRSGERASDSVYFPPREGTLAAGPFGVALSPDGERAAVSLQGWSAVALIDPCAGEVLHEAVPLLPDGRLLVVPVDPPVALRDPRDVDGDGEVDEEATRMLLRGPQAVAFSSGRVFVAFTNVLQPALDEARPMAAGPGVVAVFDIDDDTLIPGGQRILAERNPQGMTVGPDGQVWVSSTGTYAFEGGRLVAGDEGALVALDPLTLDVTAHIALGRFAPGTPAVTEAHVVLGSTLRAEALVLPLSAESLGDGTLLQLEEGQGVNTLFEAERLSGDWVVLTHFEADRLRIIDARNATLDPWPFEGGLALAPASDAFRGAQAVALDGELHGAALLGLSAEVVSLDFTQVIGP